jgi:hypothetical protein
MTGTEILNKSRTQSKGHFLLLQGEFFGHLSGKIRCAREIKIPNIGSTIALD